VAPWLITTSGWPALTALLAAATVRLTVAPVTVAAATTGALALGVALLWRARGAQRAGAQAPVAAPSASEASPSGS
jgi:hypothetical protein